jgi:hypothetical protein
MVYEELTAPIGLASFLENVSALCTRSHLINRLGSIFSQCLWALQMPRGYL